MNAKNCKLHVAAAIVAFFALVSSSHAAAIYVDTGSTTITPGANDQSQLSGNGGSVDGLNYYTDQHYMGQSFTTGSDPHGYLLTGFSLVFADPNAPNPTFSGAIGTVSGNTFTAIDTESYTTSGTITKGDWVTFTPSGTIILVPNTTYAYDLHNTTGTWDGGETESGNPYTGGQILLVDNGSNSMITFGSTGTYDAQFDVHLTAIMPEPSTIAALLGLAGMGLVGLVIRRRRRKA